MSEQKTAGALDIDVLRHAIENLDFETLADLYAEDAEVCVVNQDAPPSSPWIVRGKEEIAETYRGSYQGQQLTQRVESEVVGDDRLALAVAARYPDGKRELCAMFLDLNEDGKIWHHTIVNVRE